MSSNRKSILLEVLGFVLLAVLSKLALDPFTWRFAAPISLIFTLAVLTWHRHRQQLSWRDLGLVRVPGVKAKLAVLGKGLLVFLAIIGTGVLVAKGGTALGLQFMADDGGAAMERWGDIAGNLPLYLVWLSISWISAGFGEEMFFRGYLISRLDDLFQGLAFRRTLSVFLPALYFGLCHVYYMGPRGLILTGAIGLTLGTLFLVFKRNLWPLIIGHGLVDTLSFSAVYFQWDI